VGLVADRFIGMSKAVTFGGILLVAGHLGMAFRRRGSSSNR
jgi:POT family proton-dependent oligopeptide transporter